MATNGNCWTYPNNQTSRPSSQFTKLRPSTSNHSRITFAGATRYESAGQVSERNIMKNINRRKLIGGAALGLGVAACGGASETSESGVSAPAISKKRKRLTMVTTWPKGLPGLGTAAERVAEQIKLLTDGQIEIRVRALANLCRL